MARQIWDAIKDGTIYSCPSLLASFVLLSFADLKKYKFTYLFGFPALHSEPVWKEAIGDQQEVGKDDLENPKTQLSSTESMALVESVQTWRYRVDPRQYGFFLAKKVRGSDAVGAQDIDKAEDAPQSRTTAPETSPYGLDYSWVIDSLATYEDGFLADVDAADQYVCFADPSTYQEYPGWMLRNLLVLVRKRWGLEKVQILCYRDIQSRREDARSLVLNLTVDPRKEIIPTAGSVDSDEPMPKVSGWERSNNGKISSKIANLGEYMNPQRYEYCGVIPRLLTSPRLADQAVDLNLKLIKWRIAPGLDLDIVKNTKCLLLGAGTLGSYVARNLMVSTALAFDLRVGTDPFSEGLGCA